MSTDTYKLFIGFRKLGEFSSIYQAKLLAQKCRLAGVFSLVGENYSDSWYVSKFEVDEQ